MRHLVFAAALMCSTVVHPAVAENRATTDVAVQSTSPGVAQGHVVFLVRHAERADAGMASAKTPGTDPALSGAGIARASALAAMLKDAKITTVITTEYQRTKQTGEPVAKATGASVTVVHSKDSAGLLAAVKAAPGNILVVGHSNTLPDLMKGLGVTEPIVIGEDEYDAMFIVTRTSPPTLVRLRYR